MRNDGMALPAESTSAVVVFSEPFGAYKTAVISG